MVVEDQNPEFALIVGAARSGTTLLRLLLDAHPEIGCPAEAGLPGLMSHMARVWATVDADIREDAVATDPGQPEPEMIEVRVVNPPVGPPGEDDQAPLASPAGRVPEPARQWIRTTALAAMRRYCEREHKQLYVDKSLDSVRWLGLVRELFPDVRCVLAFRHVMDTVASGIEASPWGFHAYGYGPYVQASPGNTVAALARYWIDHVSQALEWEEQHPDMCMRVRYEDLVAHPEATVTSVQDFLGVAEDLTVLSQAFDREPPRGPGDYKVVHTSAVHVNSIGRGKRIPVSLIPPPLLAVINEKLEVLGYQPLDGSWNTAERPVNVPVGTIWTRRLQELMAQARSPSQDAQLGVFALVAEDHHALRWIIDTEASTIAHGEGDVDAVLTGTTEDLVLMLTGQENLGTLMRAGRVRYLVADEDETTRRDMPATVLSTVLTLRSCVGTDETGR